MKYFWWIDFKIWFFLFLFVRPRRLFVVVRAICCQGCWRLDQPPHMKRNDVQCTTGDQDYWGAGEANSIDFLLNGIPIEILQCPACNTHVVKKAGAIIFIAQVVDSDRYPLGDLFIFILNFSSLMTISLIWILYFVFVFFFGVFLSVLVAACFRWVMRRYFGGKTGGWCVNKSGDSFSERVLVSSSCPKVRQWIYVAIHLSIDSCSPHLKHH